MPIYDEISRRSMRFIETCLQHDSMFVEIGMMGIVNFTT